MMSPVGKGPGVNAAERALQGSWTSRVSSARGANAPMESDHISQGEQLKTPGYRLDNIEKRQDQSNLTKTGIAKIAVVASAGSTVLMAGALVGNCMRVANSNQPPMPPDSDPSLTPREQKLQAEINTLKQQVHNNQRLSNEINVATMAVALPVAAVSLWYSGKNYKNYKDSRDNKYHTPDKNAPVENTQPKRGMIR